MADYLSGSSERNARPTALSETMQAFSLTIPKEVQQRLLFANRAQKIHEQFAELVDPFILEHTNSVLMKRNVTNEDKVDLEVYLDDSTCAAELNARRELLRLKYLERFNVAVGVFEIKISRGAYKNNHPFKEFLNGVKEHQPRELSSKEIKSIEDILSSCEEGPMRDSFERAIVAQKTHQH